MSSSKTREEILRELEASEDAYTKQHSYKAEATSNKTNFMYEDPRGLVKEEEAPPEEVIPDLPENEKARKFLKKAPTKGLWLPMGVEVKVMQCWRCKAYGHRTGDRECPLRDMGNIVLDAERQAREDPMVRLVATKGDKRSLKQARKEELQRLLDEVKREEKEKKKRKRERKERKQKKKRSRDKEREKDRSERKERRRSKHRRKSSKHSGRHNSESASSSSSSSESCQDSSPRRRSRSKDKRRRNSDHGVLGKAHQGSI